MNDEPFVWVFPIYFLAKNFRAEPGSTKISMDIGRTQFHAALIDGENYLAIFTDKDAAETYLDEMLAGSDFTAIGFNPDQLQRLLPLVAPRNDVLIVDPHPKVGRYNLRSAQELTDEVERHLHGQG